LINSVGEVKLADVGLHGRIQDQRKNSRSCLSDHPGYYAPESLESGYDIKADIWTLGITAMELAFGYSPYAYSTPMKALFQIVRGDPPTIDIYPDKSYKFSKGFVSFLNKCLRKNPKKRPFANKLLQHRFFRKAQDGNYIIEKLAPK